MEQYRSVEQMYGEMRKCQPAVSLFYRKGGWYSAYINDNGEHVIPAETYRGGEAITGTMFKGDERQKTLEGKDKLMYTLKHFGTKQSDEYEHKAQFDLSERGHTTRYYTDRELTHGEEMRMERNKDRVKRLVPPNILEELLAEGVVPIGTELEEMNRNNMTGCKEYYFGIEGLDYGISKELYDIWVQLVDAMCSVSKDRGDDVKIDMFLYSDYRVDDYIGMRLKDIPVDTSKSIDGKPELRIFIGVYPKEGKNQFFGLTGSVYDDVKKFDALMAGNCVKAQGRKGKVMSAGQFSKRSDVDVAMMSRVADYMEDTLDINSSLRAIQKMCKYSEKYYLDKRVRKYIDNLKEVKYVRAENNVPSAKLSWRVKSCIDYTLNKGDEDAIKVRSGGVASTVGKEQKCLRIYKVARDEEFGGKRTEQGFTPSVFDIKRDYISLGNRLLREFSYLEDIKGFISTDSSERPMKQDGANVINQFIQGLGVTDIEYRESDERSIGRENLLRKLDTMIGNR